MTQRGRMTAALKLAVATSISFSALWAAPVPALGSDRMRDTSWASHLRAMDEALASQDIRAAVRARHEADLAAVADRGWDGPLSVGEASLRLGAAAGVRQVSERWARRAFLLAFVRARERGSLDGVLRAAEAFAAMGDREMAQHCARVAAELAGTSGGARERDRVRALQARSK